MQQQQMSFLHGTEEPQRVAPNPFLPYATIDGPRQLYLPSSPSMLRRVCRTARASRRRQLVAFVLTAFCIVTIYLHSAGPVTTNPILTADRHLLQSDAQAALGGAHGRRPRPADGRVTAVVVMAATRPAAVRNHLQQLLSLRSAPEKWPVYVSQDGDNAEVTATIKGFLNDSAKVFHIHHKDREGVNSPIHKSAKNYFLIAQHYKFALDKIFNELKYETAIITEDDLDLASDFFSYFEWTRHLLFDDPSVLCISAWNDNGAEKLVDHFQSQRLYRTDFFPGLGWMLTADTWRQLAPDWPQAYWDDWMRTEKVRKDRVCIRPEVSRTLHNMALAGKGSSNGMYKAFLNSIFLPKTPVDFSLVDTSRLMKDAYDASYGEQVRNTKRLTPAELISREKPLDRAIAYSVVYRNPREYREIAKAFQLMNDIRAGMARTAYYGVVPFYVDGARVYAIHVDTDLQNFGKQLSTSLYHDDWDKMSRYLDFAEFYCKPNKWKGKCDPNDPDMIAWFKKRKQIKRLQAWGEMIVV